MYYMQCDFRFDLLFSFSFVLVLLLHTNNNNKAVYSTDTRVTRDCLRHHYHHHMVRM